MLFLGDIVSGNHSFLGTATDLNNIKSISLTDGIVDEFFITKDVISPFNSSIPSMWNYDTILHALFKENLLAGNIDFTADMITHLRIKRREKGTHEWTVIHDRLITDNSQLSFEIYDRYARSNRNYEYSIVPCLEKIEGNLNINTVESKFDGIFIMEKEMGLQALLNSSISTQINRTSSTVTTIGRKYPIIVQNGMSDYMSGSLNATFIPFDLSSSKLDTKNGVEYRKQVHEFLNNKRPKILKHEDGRMWMIMIVDSISIDESVYYEIPSEQINFVEMGNAFDSYDLYYNNFTDINLVGGDIN